MTRVKLEQFFTFLLLCKFAICIDYEAETTEKYFTLYLDDVEDQDGDEANTETSSDEIEDFVKVGDNEPVASNNSLKAQTDTITVEAASLPKNPSAAPSGSGSAAAAAAPIAPDAKTKNFHFKLEHFSDKKYHTHFLHDVLNPHNFLKPISDKIALITDYLTYPHHPNYGGVTLLNADYIWQKFNKKHQHFVPNTNKAIFGLNFHTPNYDYPFPYRSLNARSLNGAAKDDVENSGAAAPLIENPFRPPRSYIFVENREGDRNKIYYFPYYSNQQKNDWQQILINATVPQKLSNLD